MIPRLFRFSVKFFPIGLVILCCSIFSSFMYGQSSEDAYMDNIIPPPPNAYSFVKYIDHPISHNTGVPEVSLPLFSWSNHSGLGLDLSLNYHLGGIKVEEIASNVGLGWSLQGLGVITRSMRGRPDDGPNGFIHTIVLPDYDSTSKKYGNDFPISSIYPRPYLLSGLDGANYGLLYDLSHNYQDTQQDVFYLSVAGFSLKFYIGKDKSILFEEYSNTIIVPIYGSYGYIEKFEVTDAKGIKYFFEEMEVTNDIDPFGSFEAVPSYTSSWLLTKIEHPDSQGVIEFSYENYTQSYSGIFSEVVKTRISTAPASGSTDETFTNSYRNITLYGKRIKDIDLPDGGKVSFVYDSDPREDVGISETEYGKDHRLKRIDFRNAFTNTPLYSYEFTHSYFTKPNSFPNSTISKQFTKRLKLDKVRKVKEGVYEDHEFEYFSEEIVPRNSKYQDFWGYTIADGREMSTRVPEIEYFLPSTSTTNILKGSDRSTDPIGMLSGSLKKIIYPTKGYTIFNMEANQAFDEEEDFFTKKKEYSLSFNQNHSNSTVFKNISFTIDELDAQHYTIYFDETFRENIPGAPITWLEDDLNNTPIQVRIRNSNNTWSKVLYSGTYEQFLYQRKIEKFNESVPNAGSYRLEVTVGNFTPFPIKFEGRIELISISTKKESKYVGGLRAKSIQQFDTDEQLLFEKKYAYKLPNGESSGKIGIIPNYDAYQYTKLVYWLDRDPTSFPLFSGPELWLIRNSAPTMNLGYISNSPVLYTHIKEIIKERGETTNNGSILYEFNSFNYLGGSRIYPFLSGIVDIWTSGKPKRVTYFNTSGIQVMKKDFEYETQRNEINLANHRSYKLGVVAHHNLPSILPSNETQYAVYLVYPYTGYSRLKKETTTKYFGLLNSIQETVAYTYDAKKQLKQKKLVDGQGEVTTSTLYYPYDYSNLSVYQSLVEANRIANAIQKDKVKGSSSRTREFKNYNIHNNKPQLEGIYLNYDTGSSAADVTPAALDASFHSVVKILSYDSYGNPLEVKDAQGVQSVYLWGYGGQYPIAKIDNASYSQVTAAYTASGKNPETEFTTLNQTHVSDAQINASIQKLRTNLPQAQITSFTYLPMLGLTSITNARGETTKYKYDKLGRLQRILDHDGNVIQSYCYNYAGQQVNCLSL